MRGLLVVALAFGAVSAERPVMKVVRLLQDMQTQLQNEAKEDAATYKKLQCWCDTNKQDKTLSIKQGDAKSRQLVSTIDQLSAKSAQLANEITKLKKDIANNEESLRSAADLRDKELAEFNEDHKDLLQSIKGLDAAIVVLSKHNPSASALLDAVKVGKGAIFHHEHILGDVATTAKQILGSFVQQPAGFQSYASQSGQIYGILKQMKETFEGNAGTAVKEEKVKAESFSQLKQAKQSEIKAAYQQQEDKEQEKAETDQEHAEAKQDLEDTDAALAADNEFLNNLNSKCSATDEEMARRSKDRTDEIAAVSDAIAILNDESSFDLFTKSVNTPASFIQVEGQRQQATNLLRRAAVAAKDPKLAALAVDAKLDAFTKVKASIDGMITELKKQQKDEVTHRDWCVEEFAHNGKSTAEGQQTHQALEAQLEENKATLDRLVKELKEAAEKIADTKTQTQRATDDRSAANSQFQQTVNDQRATQAVLERALARLKQYYDPEVQVKGYNALMQGAGDAPSEAPKDFGQFNKNKGGGGALAMLQTIIADSEKLEKEAIQDEADQNAAYEAFVKDANKTIKAEQELIVNKTAARARFHEERTEATKDKKLNLSDLENLSNYSGELHKSCDFVIDNFDTRQAARSQEVEALRQAKAILAGA